jgi:hypothetical protein
MLTLPISYKLYFFRNCSNSRFNNAPGALDQLGFTTHINLPRNAQTVERMVHIPSEGRKQNKPYLFPGMNPSGEELEAVQRGGQGGGGTADMLLELTG